MPIKRNVLIFSLNLISRPFYNLKTSVKPDEPCDYNYENALVVFYSANRLRVLAKHSGKCSHITPSNVTLQMA